MTGFAAGGAAEQQFRSIQYSPERLIATHREQRRLFDRQGRLHGAGQETPD